MARIKNIEAFCGVCGSVTKMELAGESSVLNLQNKRWARCKKCKQMTLVNLSEVENKKDDKVGSGEITFENSIEYAPQKTFGLGDAIYHKTWDDFGRVVAKEVSSNGQNTILVDFQKSGIQKNGAPDTSGRTHTHMLRLRSQRTLRTPSKRK
jgi:hypothetical protein